MSKVNQYSENGASATDSPGCNKTKDLIYHHPSRRGSWIQKLKGIFGCFRSTVADDRFIFCEQTTIVGLSIFACVDVDGFRQGVDVHLPPKQPNTRRRTLILDLDETLVHSSFEPIENYDLVIPVEITGRSQNVYVRKRPDVDEFLSRVKLLYEVVIFTASLPVYADPVISQLDRHKVVSHRLFRQHCVRTERGYVKDLRSLGRDLEDTVIVDNSPEAYARQPFNSVPIKSWFGDMESDRSLIDTILPILEEIANHEGSVYDCTRRLSANSIELPVSDHEGKAILEPDEENIIASVSPRAISI